MAFSSPSSSSQSKPLSHAKTVSVKAGKTSAKSGPVTPFKGVLGLQSGKVAKRGKRQQLQKALNKRNKGGLGTRQGVSLTVFEQSEIIKSSENTFLCLLLDFVCACGPV